MQRFRLEAGQRARAAAGCVLSYVGHRTDSGHPLLDAAARCGHAPTLRHGPLANRIRAGIRSGATAPSTHSTCRPVMLEAGHRPLPATASAEQDPGPTARSRQALFTAGALEHAILTSANFSIIATDEKGIIQLFNVGAERMLGYTAAELINKARPGDMHDPQEVAARARALSLELAIPIAAGFEAMSFKASRGVEDIHELTYVRKDGSRFPAVVSITALRDEDRKVIGYLLIGSDNSARKQDELKLSNAMAAAENANLAKSDFLSSMSHELRTPLSAILGFAQLMESGSPPPTDSQQRSIEQILKAGWHLLELINEILDLAQIESGKMRLSLEPISLLEILTECRSMIETQARTRDISVSFPTQDPQIFVDGDRTRLKQVLINLLSNAVKYNKVGGSVAVDYTLTAQGRVRIRVTDSGEGLSADKLTQLFQPFNRLGKETGIDEGTGIGLMVSKRLIELMKGEIGVHSTVGVGSEFWIELDRSEQPQKAAPATASVSAPRTAASTAGRMRTVLYVEDNSANLMLVEELIARRTNIRLISAVDGNQGVQIACDSLPDVILMDINLPGISGVQALKLLHANPATAHIPVIALSANAMPRDIERGLAIGFFRYLTKPIKVKELMDTLDTAMISTDPEHIHDSNGHRA
jgi:signal transduction histidine kinase/CheY-like chemotaxis protein